MVDRYFVYTCVVFPLIIKFLLISGIHAILRNSEEDGGDDDDVSDFNYELENQNQK